MSEDIKVTDGTVLEALNNKVDLDGGNYKGSELEAYIHKHCSGRLNMFDTVLKDHILTYEESKGLALQGTWVYKKAIAGSRYGYADFYNKCLEEYKDSSNEKQWLKSNITNVGSVVDNQGVLSGFSSTSWAVLPNNFNVGSSAWELVVSFTTGTIGADQYIVNSSSLAYQPFGIWLSAGGKISASGYVNNSTTTLFTISGSSVLSANTKYFVSLSYNSITGYTLGLGTSLDNLSVEGTSTVTTPINTGYNIALGADFSADGAYYNGAFTGSIDLNESYININGERWWTGIDTLTKNSNGHLFYDISQKDRVDEVFTSTGTAWFYGVDTENERIFLPRNNWFEQATTDESEVGNFVEAGLPNITGAASSWTTKALSDNSALYAYDGKGSYIGGGVSANGLAFDASRSNSIYGKSDTVQPNAVKKLLYICVGNTESVSSVTDVIDVTTTENDTTPLFTGMYFDFTPNNVSWLKGGRTVDGADIYAFVYNELVNILNGETKYGELKVIDEADMIAGIDYSLYWKVNQTDMTFTTPTAISNKALSGAVVGNGMTLGLTNGSQNGGLGANTSNGYLGAYSDKYGVDVGVTTSTNIITNTLGVTTDPTKSGIIAEQSTSQLYFKVANAVQNLELLNVGQVMENAVLRSSLQECQVVIETYTNGTSWYRIWSDGFCEQSGKTDKGTKIEITLLKPYKDTNYQIMVGQYHTGATDMHGTVVRDSKTINGFTIAGNANVDFNWEVKGYIW